MTKAALESMIAALKDRCKTSMDVHACCSIMPTTMGHAQSSALPSLQPICPDQIISLTALISYVAFATGRCEYRIERELSNHFCIPNPKCLPQQLYDQAVHFMVEQVPQNNC